jgi:deoxyribonucleoside regulator
MTTKKVELHRPRSADLVIETAWRYFHDGENQNEIADALGLSRGTVVNYLAEARARQFVRVSLQPEVFREVELARQLRDAFGLADAYVIPRPVGMTDRDALKRVARAAGDWLPGALEPGDVLGVSWGETVYEVSLAVPSTRCDVTVVQLVGSYPSPLGFAAETCSSNIAQRLQAHCINLNVPLLVSSEELADMLRAEPAIAAQLAAARGCNKTLFAAGTCTMDSHVVKLGVVTPDQLKQARDRGAEAVIGGQFIDAAGSPVPLDVQRRMLSVELDQMKDKETGILVSVGADRAKSTLAAIRGRFASHLITCSATARALLDVA